MADDQESGAAGEEALFEDFDGEDVEVVGGLVQQDDVRIEGEGPGQGRAPALAAREAGGSLGGIETEGLEGRFGLVPGGAAGSRVVGESRTGHGRLLLDHDDAQTRRNRPFALIGRNGAGQNAHQGRLAGPVAADQAGADARLQPDIDTVEHQIGPVGETDILESEHRGGHGGAFPKASGGRGETP